MNLFHEAKYRESLAPLLNQKQLSARQQRAFAWLDVLSNAPSTPREYMLRAITARKLSKRDAERYVLGTALSAAERRRDYLKWDGEAFDLFVMECLYDFYGDYNARTMRATIREWEEELWNIIQELRSSKQARELLIDSWLAVHGPYYKPKPSTFTRDDTEPAF